MKLASLKARSRDGELVVVSRDLSRATDATKIAPTLQAALEDWERLEPALQRLFGDLEAGDAPSFALDPERLAAPLPRPFGWIDSSVYLSHMELARSLRNAKMPEIYRREPLLSARVPEPFAGPREPIFLPPGDMGLDIEAEVGMILGDVRQGATLAEAARGIRLLTLVNDVSLRTIYARDADLGKTAFHGKTIPSMAPVALTPDELGEAWSGGKIHLPMECEINGKPIGRPEAGVDMQFSLPEILEQAVLYRGLGAGTVIGSGTISNHDRSVGSCCLAEVRMIEKLQHGEPRTPYLKPGDEIRITMRNRDGKPLFGDIRQRVRA